MLKMKLSFFNANKIKGKKKKTPNTTTNEGHKSLWSISIQVSDERTLKLSAQMHYTKLL